MTVEAERWHVGEALAFARRDLEAARADLVVAVADGDADAIGELRATIAALLDDISALQTRDFVLDYRERQ